MDPLTIATNALTNLSFLLIIGIAISLLADSLKLPRILLLLLTGILLGNIYIEGSQLISIPETLTLGIAIFSLIMIVFSGTITLKIKDVDIESGPALKLLFLFMTLNLLLITPFSILFFGTSLIGVTAAIILAIISSGTDAASVFSISKNNTSIYNLLRIEAIVNTPIIVVIPLIFVKIVQEGYGSLTKAVLEKSMDILKLFIIGIGTGIVIGIILFKTLKKITDKNDQQVLLFSGAFLTYVLAEAMGGDGIVAVATLGIIFATYYTRLSTTNYSVITARALEILVFLLLGISIKIPLNAKFLLESIIIFLLLLLSRYLAVRFTLKKEEFTGIERLTAFLVMPKGIATGVTALALVLIEPSFARVSAIILLITVYSLVLASIAEYFIARSENHVVSRTSGK